MRKIKTEKVVSVYGVLAEAKITKMEDKDKFKVIKALKELKVVAKAFEDFRTDALEKLKGEEHDKMVERAQQWQREGDKTTLTEDERIEVNKYLTDYNTKVAECLKEEAEKENDITFEPLTEEALGKLVASNDWTVRQIMEIEEVLA